METPHLAPPGYYTWPHQGAPLRPTRVLVRSMGVATPVPTGVLVHERPHGVVAHSMCSYL